jgi:hypothetical protein
MRTLKMLGLAAIAALGLMAFVGAGTASAATTCKTKPNAANECPAGWHYPIGTISHMTLKAGTSANLTNTAGETIVTCTESTIKTHSTTTGGLNQPVKKAITVATWGSVATPCTTTTDTTALGELQVEATSGGNGTVSGSGSKVTVNFAGVSCVYGTGAGTTIGTVTGGEPATVDVNAVVNKQEGGFLCPTTTLWKATYVVTEPKPLWIANA